MYLRNNLNKLSNEEKKMSENYCNDTTAHRVVHLTITTFHFIYVYTTLVYNTMCFSSIYNLHISELRLYCQAIAAA